MQRWLMAGTANPSSPPSVAGGGFSPAASNQIAPELSPVPVEFPRHLYPPPGVDTIDFRIVRQMDPTSEFDLIDFTPQLQGIQATVFITHYAIFNDGLLEADFAFQPTLNGARIYPFHGNPAFNPSLISLGLGPDETNNSLINGYLVMNPQDRLVWRAFNKDVVSVAMGVRVVGYVDQTSKRRSVRIGG